MTGCGSVADDETQGSAPSSTKVSNTNPQDGWVLVDSSGNKDRVIYKRCDGTVLLYSYDRGNARTSASGLAAVADSSECQPD